MKIDGPGKSSDTKGVSKNKKKQGSSVTSGTSFKSLLGQSGDDKVSGKGSLGATGGVNAIWALQEAGTATDHESRGKAIQRADDILDGLEELRMGILLGAYSQSQLENLQRQVSSKTEQIEDSRLKEILEEIDMRAQIELAKMDKK